MKRNTLIATCLALLVTLSSCGVAKGIFNVGFALGAIVVIIVVVLIIRMAGKGK